MIWMLGMEINTLEGVAGLSSDVGPVAVVVSILILLGR